MKMKWLQWNDKELLLKNEKQIIFLEIVLCTLLLISVCFNNNVWWDEAYTYNLVANHSVWGMVMETAVDVHPPLYYLLAKVGAFLFGKSLLVQKMVVVVAAVCSMILGGTYVRERFGVKTSIAFIFLIAFAPQMAVYNVQLRMYSWAAFFTLGSAVYAYRIVLQDSKKNWCMFLFFSLCGAYTLYFAAVTIAFIYGFLLIHFLQQDRSRLKKWLVACGVTILAYCPWLYMFVTISVPKFEGNTPNESLFVKGLFRDFWNWSFENGIHGDTFIYLCILMCSIVTLIVLKNRFGQGERFFVIVLLLSTVWTWLIGAVFTFIAGRSLLHRYMFSALLLLWFGIAIIIGKYRNRVFYIFMAMMCILGAYNYKFVYHDEYHIAPRIDVTEKFIEENMHPDDLVVFELEPYELMYQYYMPEQELVYYQNLDLGQHVGESFWYIDAWGDYFSQEEIETYHIVKEEYGDFGIQSMDFKIYKITVNGNE